MNSLLKPLVGLLPVMMFLLALVYLDSYKLTKLRTVLTVVCAGGLMAVAAYLCNAWLITFLQLDLQTYSHWVGPVIEECLKALIMLYLIQTHRVGFLVDAAILGFAVGAGFAVVENFYYLEMRPAAGLGLWVIRGFGTTFMHGAVAAIFGVVALTLTGRSKRLLPTFMLPGLIAAITIHAVFNHFYLSPIVSTAGTMLILPLLLYEVFQRGEKLVGNWLGKGFDADAELLELLNSGDFSESPLGRYLHTLKDRFKGLVVADILCFVRLHTELALRAKGLLMMRESGFDLPVDEETREKFAEMQFLEKSIGKTGLRAIQPMLHMSRQDLWQLYMLEDVEHA